MNIFRLLFQIKEQKKNFLAGGGGGGGGVRGWGWGG